MAISKKIYSVTTAADETTSFEKLGEALKLYMTDGVKLAEQVWELISEDTIHTRTIVIEEPKRPTVMAQALEVAKVPRAKLNAKDIHSICAQILAKTPITVIAKKYNVSPSFIYMVKLGRAARWKAISQEYDFSVLDDDKS